MNRSRSPKTGDGSGSPDTEALAEAAPPPKSELDLLADEIIGSVSGDGQLVAEKLEILQTKVDGLGDDELDKLKFGLEAGINARLNALSTQVESDKSKPPESFEVEAKDIAYSTIDGIRSETDTEAVMVEAQKKWTQAMRRSQLSAEIESEKSGFSTKIVAILTGLGIWKLIPQEKQEAIQLSTDSESINKHVLDVTSKYAKELGIDSGVELDADDLAILVTHQESTAEQPSMIDQIASGLPVVGTAYAAGQLLQSADHVEAYNKASKEMNVSKRTLRRLAGKTFAELETILEGQDTTKPPYDEILIVRDAIAERSDFLSGELNKAIDELNYPDLTEQDKVELKSEYNVDNMYITDIMLLLHGQGLVTRNWFVRSLTRMPTLMRSVKYWYGAKKQYLREEASYAAAKLFRRGEQTGKTSRSVSAFRQLNRELKAGTIDLSHFNQIETLQGELKDLDTDVRTLEAKVRTISTDDMSQYKGALSQEKDALIRRMNMLTHKKSSRLVSAMYADLSHSDRFAKALQAAAQNGNVDVQAVLRGFDKPQVAERYLKKLFGGRMKGIMTVVEVERMNMRLVDDLGQLKKYKTLLEDGFTATKLALDETGSRLEGVRKLAKGGTKAARMGEVAQDVKALTFGGKVKRWAPRVAIPIVAVGAELYGVAKGDVALGDVKWDVAEAAGGFVPVVGTALDFKAFFTEKTLSGRELKGWERWSTLGFACVGVVADALTVFGGLGVGMRAGLQGMRTAGKLGRGGRTMSKWGSIPFKVGAKTSDALHSFTKVGNVTRFKELQSASHALEWGDLSKQARKLGGFDKLPIDLQRRFSHLDQLKDAGELPRNIASGNFLVRGYHRAKVGVEKGIRGSRIGASDLASISRLDKQIDVAQSQVKSSKQALQALIDKGIKEGDVFEKASNAVRGAEKVLGMRKAGKYNERVWREMKRTANIEKFKYADLAANYAMYGGIAVGGFALLTAGHPEEVLEAAGSAGKIATKPFGWAWENVWEGDWETHKDKPPIHKALYARIEQRHTLGKLNQELAEAKEKGVNPIDVWKKWVDNPWARQEAMKQGVWPQLEAMIPQGAVTAESVMGDAAGKVKETTA